MNSWKEYQAAFSADKNTVFYAQIYDLSKERRRWNLLRDAHKDITKLFSYGESELLVVQLQNLTNLKHLSFHIAHLSIEAAAAILSHPTLKIITITGVKLEDSPGYHMLASASKILDLDIKIHPNTRWVCPNLDLLMHRCFPTLQE